MKVLITGASGNLGTKIRSHLHSVGDRELVLLDVDGKGDPSVREADLSLYDETWVEYFSDVQAVLHLAANPHVNAPWESIQRRMSMKLQWQKRYSASFLLALTM